MTDQQLVHDLFGALEARCFDRALSYLGCDFQCWGAAERPLDRQEWIGVFRALAAALPDLRLNFEATGAGYGVVSGSFQPCGRHSCQAARGDAAPAGDGGGTIALPRAKVDVAVARDQVTMIKLEGRPDAGLGALLAQLGAAPPGQG